MVKTKQTLLALLRQYLRLVTAHFFATLLSLRIITLAPTLSKTQSQAVDVDEIERHSDLVFFFLNTVRGARF